MKLPEYCQALAAKLAEQVDTEQMLQLASVALQQAFKVSENEVAFLLLDNTAQSLRFIWPQKLQSAGSIPLSTRDSLAACTVRENRAARNNRFAKTFHASIFEQIPTGSAQSRALPIQKIMSAPLVSDGVAIGAVQICRKGDEQTSAGADFSAIELEALTEIAKVLGGHIAACE